MTLRTTNSSDTSSTDAQFRAIAQVVHDHLAATGMVQTADTGQINLTTVLRPVATSTAAGYEVWRFSDSLQATAPIYLKVEYGSGSTNVGTFGMWLTVGTGSDGAGTLTSTAWPSGGTVTSRRQTGGSGSGGGAALPTYCEYLADGSGFALLLWPSSAATAGGQLLAVERFRNSDGTPSGDGVIVFYAYSPSSSPISASESRVYLTGVTQPTGVGSGWPTVYGGHVGGASALVGTTLYPDPVFTGALGRLAGASQLLHVVGRTDMNALTTFTMTHYGSPRTWLCAGPGAGSTTGWGAPHPTLQSFVMRGD